MSVFLFETNNLFPNFPQQRKANISTSPNLFLDKNKANRIISRNTVSYVGGSSIFLMALSEEKLAKRLKMYWDCVHSSVMRRLNWLSFLYTKIINTFSFFVYSKLWLNSLSLSVCVYVYEYEYKTYFRMLTWTTCIVLHQNQFDQILKNTKHTC
jgi:hypothetical protein